MIDETPAAGCSSRMRMWDACLFKDYALVAGGHNFREHRPTG
jgi:hypothetical protein